MHAIDAIAFWAHHSPHQTCATLNEIQIVHSNAFDAWSGESKKREREVTRSKKEKQIGDKHEVVLFSEQYQN